jgi:hypothetical protein
VKLPKKELNVIVFISETVYFFLLKKKKGTV